MSNIVKINNKIENFKKTIKVPGDKSLSIRWVLFASLSSGKSKAKNLLMSEDVMATIYTLRKLGIKILIKKKECIIFGKGIDGYKYKKNLILDAKNSGTLGRLILGLLVNSTKPIKLIGDKSLSKRDFLRVCKPLSKFGAKFKLKDKKFLPLKICGSSKLNRLNTTKIEVQLNAKVRLCLAMRTEGTTIIKQKIKKSYRTISKHLRLPISIKSHKILMRLKSKK